MAPYSFHHYQYGYSSPAFYTDPDGRKPMGPNDPNTSCPPTHVKNKHTGQCDQKTTAPPVPPAPPKQNTAPPKGSSAPPARDNWAQEQSDAINRHPDPINNGVKQDDPYLYIEQLKAFEYYLSHPVEFYLDFVRAIRGDAGALELRLTDAMMFSRYTYGTGLESYLFEYFGADGLLDIAEVAYDIAKSLNCDASALYRIEASLEDLRRGLDPGIYAGISPIDEGQYEPGRSGQGGLEPPLGTRPVRGSWA